jgi:transposase
MKNDYNLQLEKYKALVNDKSTLIIGIDVSRLKHDACFGTKEKIFSRKFEFSNDLLGFKKLIEKIKKLCAEEELANILLGVEPTSFYWYPLHEYLKSNELTLCLLDPISVYHNRKTMKRDSGKSDIKDAYAIFDLMNQKKFFFTANRTKRAFSAKIALKNWMNSQKALICVKNRMRSFLSLVFPELESRTEDISLSKFLAFLNKYPTPSVIVKLSENDFIIKCLEELKGYKTNELKEIYNLATTTVGVPLLLEMDSLVIKKNITDMKYQFEQEDIWFQYCYEIAKADPNYEKVSSIKGLGPKITTGLVLSLGDYASITNATQTTKLAGLNLVDKTSGSSVNKPSHISHQGNNALRFWGYHAALQVIKHSGPFKILYARKKKSSPGKGSGKRALIAVSDKIIRVAWAILKKGEDYNKDHDKKVEILYKPE